MDQIDSVLELDKSDLEFEMWPSHKFYIERQISNNSKTKHLKIKMVINDRTESTEIPHFGIGLMKNQGNIEQIMELEPMG
jgi:hypothetical protein